MDSGAAKKKPPYNLKTQIRSALRKVWMYSPMRREALVRTKIGYGKYRCPKCAGVFGPKLMDVDHNEKVTPKNFDPDSNPREWGIIVERMLYMNPVTGLTALCKTCHSIKTKEERLGIKSKKKTKSQPKKSGRTRRA